VGYSHETNVERTARYNRDITEVCQAKSLASVCGGLGTSVAVLAVTGRAGVSFFFATRQVFGVPPASHCVQGIYIINRLEWYGCIVYCQYLANRIRLTLDCSVVRFPAGGAEPKVGKAESIFFMRVPVMS
jgi:hypothetical protein